MTVPIQDLAEIAMRQIELVLRDQMPALLVPDRIAALAAAALEDIDMLKSPRGFITPAQLAESIEAEVRAES